MQRRILNGEAMRLSSRVPKHSRVKRPRERARTSIIPDVAIYPRASEHNMPILIANMRTTPPDKCVSFNETRVYLAR